MIGFARFYGIVPPGSVVDGSAGYPEAVKWHPHPDNDGPGCWAVRLYNNSGGATLAGGVYTVTFTGVVTTNPQVIDCAAVTVDVQVVVALEVIPDGDWGWFAVQGYCDALVDGDSADVAAGDFLKIVAGTNADAFIKDGASRTADSFAIACEANTSTEALKKVYLFGDFGDID
jgi:hypothetical protein